MLVEHDPWRVECVDDGNIRINGGHGMAYSSLVRDFPPGHSYKVSGQMGWSCVLAVAADGTKTVSDVQAGPHLATPPKCSIADNGAFEARFGMVPEFHFRIPVDYGQWEIPGAYDGRAGFRYVELPDGSWKVTGEGWAVPVKVEKRVLKLGGSAEGLPAGAAKIDADGLTLPDKDMPLPAPAEDKTPVGYLSVTDQRTKAMSLQPVFESPAKVEGVDFELAEGKGIIGVGKTADVTLVVGVESERGSLETFARFIKGGGMDWKLSATLTPLDLSSVHKGADVAVKLRDASGRDAARTQLDGLAPGAYVLNVKAQSPDGKAACEANVLVPVKGAAPACSLWLPQGRLAYAASERIGVYVWLSNPKAADAELVAVREGFPPVSLGKIEEPGLVHVEPFTFSPGDVAVQLKMGGKLAAQRTFTVLADDLKTSFIIMAYASILDRYEDANKLDSLGVKGFLEQSGAVFGLRGRADATAKSLARAAQWLPEVGPADRYATPSGGFMEHLDRKGWKFYAQWGSAHQPWGYGVTFTDHAVVNRLAASSGWASMAGRQHPCFWGMNVFDEGGTPRGPKFTDDASWIEYQAFEKKFGRPKPNYFGEDTEAARAWIYDKQHQHDVVYSGIGHVLDQINRYADPGSYLFLGTQNGNLNSMAVDGGHPPLAYGAISLSTFHWYPDYFHKAFILAGNEYHFMQPQFVNPKLAGPPVNPRPGFRANQNVHTPIEFYPLIWSDGDIDLTRHEVSLAITRQVDGIAHFHWPGMLDQKYFSENPDPEIKRYGDGFKAMHAKLTKIGDMLRTIRRDRASEVAVLYSLYDFAPKLYPTKEKDFHAYDQAFHACYTGYCTMISLLRAGVQAGWLCEEEILNVDGLKGRRVLIVPGITSMMPELQAKIERFAARGGTVFVDQGTTVKIAGAKPLPIDFANLADTTKTDKGTKLDTLFMPQVLPVIKQHVVPLVKNVVEPADTDLLVTRQVNGDAVYWLGVNQKLLPLDQLPKLNCYERQKYMLPIETKLTMPGDGVVYDLMPETLFAAGYLRAGSVPVFVFRDRRAAEAHGNATVDVKLQPGDLCAYAVLPEAIGSIKLSAPRKAAVGKPVELRVEVLGESGKLLKAAVPFTIEFTKPMLPSRSSIPYPVRQQLDRSTDSGRWKGSFAVGLFDPSTVTVTVREWLSGKEASAVIQVTAKASIDTKQGSVLAENALALPGFFKSAKAMYVVIGEHTPETAVEPLVEALRGRKIDTLVRRASQVAVKQFDTHIGRGIARINGGFPGAGDALELDRPAIVIGSAADNRLVNYVMWDRRWTTCGAMGGFPGACRGYVSFLWRPFSLVDDGIVAVADDADGLEGVVRFLAKSVK